MKRATAILFPVALVALVVSASGCDVVFQGMNAKASDEWKRTYKLAEGGEFQLINPVGSIEIAPSSDATTVEVVAERHARGASEQAAKQELNRIRITEEATPTSVHIQVLRGSSDSGLHLGGGGQDVAFKVKLPKNATLKLESRVGEIRLTGLAGNVRIDNANGDIVGEEMSGPIRAATRNGNVRFAVTSVQADGIRLDSTNGVVELRLPANSKATVSARWVNGAFETDGVKLEGERERRRFEGTLNGGGPRIEMNTTNGVVKISG